ncbi:bifunctional DNA-formamidopyrimidine glycosylase/DNA-(apurinic or apyrimidinic site) lyase [bacterium]|nr:bifunctional DNA-formamidopyrimidine glycosylase/DNA-(apurinic or apyrimidinic site) lyase [bacterium]
MPELPEVETVRRTIEPHVVGRRIASVDVRERRLRRPVAPDFAARLLGRRIHGVARRAKYLLLDVDDRAPRGPLDDGPGGRLRWVVHLGMSGRFCVGEPPDLPHVHVVVELDDGGRLWFRDPRRFGAMFLSESEADLGTIGVEPLGDDFDGDLLWRETRRHRRVAIKNLVMDQRVVAGVGNIYANEALFDAGVRPSRRSGRVTRAEAGRIVGAVRAVLARAIASGGSSLLDYRDAEGNRGAFQESFAVYERAGEPCPRCGAALRRSVIGARGTFWCAACQH